MSPILGIWASQNYSRYSLPTSFESIATTTVGSGGAATVTFSSIPSTYTHLQIRAISRISYASTVTTDASFIRFNSDTGNNYSRHRLTGNGASAASFAQTSQSSMWGTAEIGGTSVTNFFAAGVIDILDYANTNKYKTIRTFAGADGNTTNDDFLYLNSGLWQSTSAINSITLIGSSGNFAEYSSFALYGIKGE